MNHCLLLGRHETQRSSLAGAKGHASSSEFTLVFLGGQSLAKPGWTAQGAIGAFAGPDDGQYAVLSNSGGTVRLYATQASDGKPAVLRKLDMGAGGALAIFPGPPWASLPRQASSSSSSSSSHSQNFA